MNGKRQKTVNKYEGRKKKLPRARKPELI